MHGISNEHRSIVHAYICHLLQAIVSYLLSVIFHLLLSPSLTHSPSLPLLLIVCICMRMIKHFVFVFFNYYKHDVSLPPSLSSPSLLTRNVGQLHSKCNNNCNNNGGRNNGTARHLNCCSHKKFCLASSVSAALLAFLITFCSFVSVFSRSSCCCYCSCCCLCFGVFVSGASYLPRRHSANCLRRF